MTQVEVNAAKEVARIVRKVPERANMTWETYGFAMATVEGMSDQEVAATKKFATFVFDRIQAGAPPYDVQIYLLREDLHRLAKHHRDCVFLFNEDSFEHSWNFKEIHNSFKESIRNNSILVLT